MRKTASVKIISVAAALLLIIAGAAFLMARGDGSGSEQQCESIKEAVSGRALQCYVIEGSYPESLDYLKDKYGLAVNTEEYRVIYIPVAQNLPPEIRVVPRAKD